MNISTTKLSSKFLEKDNLERFTSLNPKKKKYAIKIIPVTKENKLEAKTEAEMYVAYKHPNILKAREFFFFKKEQYLIIVLEYCPDGNLSNFIGKLDPAKCKEFMAQVAEGLVYLHE